MVSSSGCCKKNYLYDPNTIFTGEQPNQVALITSLATVGGVLLLGGFVFCLYKWKTYKKGKNIHSIIIQRLLCNMRKDMVSHMVDALTLE